MDGSGAVVFSADTDAGGAGGVPVLHWGLVDPARPDRGWRLPPLDQCPPGTVDHKRRARQTPLAAAESSAGAEANGRRTVSIRVSAEAARDAAPETGRPTLVCVLKEAASGEWFDARGGNFECPWPDSAATEAAAAAALPYPRRDGPRLAPREAVPDDLAGVWAYLAWERAGSPERPAADAEREYAAGILELRALLGPDGPGGGGQEGREASLRFVKRACGQEGGGVSREEAEAALRAAGAEPAWGVSAGGAAVGEAAKVEGGGVRGGDDHARRKAEREAREKEREARRAAEAEAMRAAADAAAATYAAAAAEEIRVASPVAAPLESVDGDVGEGWDGDAAPGGDPLALARRPVSPDRNVIAGGFESAAAAPGSGGDLEPPEPLRPLYAALAADDTVVWQRLFPLGDGSALLVACRTSAAPGADAETVAAARVDVELWTDSSERLVLHWGAREPRKGSRGGGERGGWKRPPATFGGGLPVGTTDHEGGKAVETPFAGCSDEGCIVEVAGALVPLQRVVIPTNPDDGASSLVCVVRSADGTRWWKDGGDDFRIPLPFRSDGGSSSAESEAELVASLSPVVAEICRHEQSSSWTLMHRFNAAAEAVDNALSGRYGSTATEVGEAMAAIFAWLRLSSSRQLTWQRSYNTQPRILSAAQDRLVNALERALRSLPVASAAGGWARLSLGCVGRGGDGQRVRDDILHIMHRHKARKGTRERNAPSHRLHPVSRHLCSLCPTPTPPVTPRSRRSAAVGWNSGTKSYTTTPLLTTCPSAKPISCSWRTASAPTVRARWTSFGRPWPKEVFQKLVWRRSTAR